MRHRKTPEELYGAPLKLRAVPRKGKNWKELADGSISSDGVHASIAGLFRRIFGFAGETNADGVFWVSLETRGKRSRVGGQIAQQRGCIAGFPEIIIGYQGRAYLGEAKRPAHVSALTGHREPAEALLPSQEDMHPQLRAAGFPVAVWHDQSEALASVVDWGLPHKTIVL